MKVDFAGLQQQRERLGDQIETAFARVLKHGQFISGPEVTALEDALSSRCGNVHCVSCANGTDALVLALAVNRIGPGDAVIVPSFTFSATAGAVAALRATPVFADVGPESYNIEPASIEQCIDRCRSAGLNPRAVIPVDLFGNPADYDAIAEIAAAHDLVVIADAAQSFGAGISGRPVGSLAPFTTTSFFPTKPLGCYGDGGAVFASDERSASLLRSLRHHGVDTRKFDAQRIGINSRLDTIQAAILIEKLTILDDELRQRRALAKRYSTELSSVAAVPKLAHGVESAWAHYTLRLPGRSADVVKSRLAECGVSSARYYPLPLHKQKAFAGLSDIAVPMPNSERLCEEVLSLPVHPYLDEAGQSFVIAQVKKALST